MYEGDISRIDSYLRIFKFIFKIAERSTKKNTFGWVRAEVLGALINGVFLLALCFTILMESITRFFEPQMIKEPRNVFIVGVIGLIINLLGMLMFHGIKVLFIYSGSFFSPFT